MKHFRSRLLIVTLLLVGTLGLPEQPVALEVSSSKTPHPDDLGSSSWWLSKVKSQAAKYRGQHFRGCLFGDSISSGLGNNLGAGTVNFSMGGLSSVSLVEQLKILRHADIHCQKAIVAVGTNDAWYITRNELFVSKLKQSIQLVRSLGAMQITLIPAFYSTIAASKDPSLAGSIARVEEINDLMHQIATAEQIPIRDGELQGLFANKSLKEEMTFDGVHLNESGRRIYRQLVVDTLNSKP